MCCRTSVLDPAAVSSDRARAAHELQQLLLDTEDFAEFLNEVARYAVETIAPTTACGLTMQRDGKLVTVASSGDFTRCLDEVQYGHDKGPCLTALRIDTTVIVTDLTADDRWNEDYKADAFAHGLAASISVPLDVGPDLRGALNFYTHPAPRVRHHRATPGREPRRGSLPRAAPCPAAQRPDPAHPPSGNRHGLPFGHRPGLRRYHGPNRCTATEAFTILRRASNHRNIKLRDLAQEIVMRISGQSPLPASHD